MFGVSGRGAIAAGTAPFLLATTVATFGLPEAVTYAASRRPDVLRVMVKRAAALAVLAGICSGIVMILLAPVAAGNVPSAKRLIVVTAILVPLALVVAVLRAAAGSQGRWGLVAAEQVVSAVLRLALLVGLAATNHLGLVGAVVLTVAAPIVGGVVYIRIGRPSPVAQADELMTAPERFSSVLSYASKIWIGSLFGIALLRLDQALMAPLSSAFELGLYAVAVNISEVPLIVSTAVRDVTFAAQSKQNEDDQLAGAARVTLLATTVFALLVALPMPWWLPLVFGHGFSGSVLPAVILLAAVAAGTPGSLAGAGLSARGRPGRRSLSLAIAAVINALMLVALVPSMGANGAALATLVGNIVASHSNIVMLAKLGGPPARRFYALGRGDVRTLTREARQLARRAPVTEG